MGRCTRGSFSWSRRSCTGRAGSEIGYSCEEKSLWLSCRHVDEVDPGSGDLYWGFIGLGFWHGKIDQREHFRSAGLLGLNGFHGSYRCPRVPLHHSDPFDRRIIAQALAENIRVVALDEKFSRYKGLKIIW